MSGSNAFLALVQAVSGAVRDDEAVFASGLASAPAQTLYAQAVRHRCAGLLFEALVRLRVRGADIAEIRALLQRYAASCALQASALRAQVDSLVRTLHHGGVPHALLKTAARLYAGDRAAEWTYASDIDVMVPRARAHDAAQALLDAGYRWGFPSCAAEAYRRHHHHLAPLEPLAGGKPVELHVALAPAWAFTTASAWSDLELYLSPVDGAPASTVKLNGAGVALHMMLHGAGLYRLFDLAAAAQALRADPALLSRLQSIAECERHQHTPMLAALAVAARLAGLAFDEAPCVRKYVEWTFAREDLPPGIRQRAHFIDAWFANGRRLRGPATPLAVPRHVHSVRHAPAYRELAGRALGGIAVWGYYMLRHGSGRA